MVLTSSPSAMNPDADHRALPTSRMVVYGTGQAVASVLGPASLRIPTAGKIRPGIKVLTRKAAESPRAVALYEQGVAAGQSFDQIEKTLAQALPQLKNPLVPRNVQWFTVRHQDFSNPDLARQLMDAYGEDRGEGVHLYRFPVVFPSDHWASVMPHELAVWGTHDKKFWSEYSEDGSQRLCKCHAPVPRHEGSHRTVRLFGGRKTMLRDTNGGRCEPENCPEYQARECNLSGRFVFFIPGVRSVSAFELHTNSFYAMSAAIQTFKTIAFMRGGRISGFLDHEQTPFYLSKKLMEVSRIDEDGRAVRVSQWIIELEAPVDITTLLRASQGPTEADGLIVDAAESAHILDPGFDANEATSERSVYSNGANDSNSARTLDVPSPASGAWFDRASEASTDSWATTTSPTLQQVLSRAESYGVASADFEVHATRQWGAGWKLNPQGRARAWKELERHRNDPAGYADKLASQRVEEAANHRATEGVKAAAQKRLRPYTKTAT
jgi:hypothetical protein